MPLHITPMGQQLLESTFGTEVALYIRNQILADRSCSIFWDDSGWHIVNSIEHYKRKESNQIIKISCWQHGSEFRVYLIPKDLHYDYLLHGPVNHWLMLLLTAVHCPEKVIEIGDASHRKIGGRCAHFYPEKMRKELAPEDV